MFYFRTDRDDVVTLSVMGEKINRVIASTHPNFDEIFDYLESTTEHDEDTVARLLEPGIVISEALEAESSRLAYAHGIVTFDGQPIDASLSDHLVARVQSGDDDWDRFVRFLENLDENPSTESRRHLYRFLDKHGLTITAEGHFLAFKGVQDDYRSSRSGPFVAVNGESIRNDERPLNLVGNVLTMPRSKVDDNRNEACGAGLHVGNHRYANSFGRRLMRVTVNPADVVAVPSDSNDEKVRVARYTVVDEVSEEQRAEWGYVTSWDVETDDEPEDFEPLDDVEDEEAEVQPATVAEWAETDAAYKKALHDPSVGHKQVARLFPDYGTESSVRRYRKAQGVSLNLRAKVGL